MVILLALVLGGYHFNVSTGKGGKAGKGAGGGHHHTPKVTQSATP
jgi:hypothetical protein